MMGWPQWTYIALSAAAALLALMQDGELYRIDFKSHIIALALFHWLLWMGDFYA